MIFLLFATWWIQPPTGDFTVKHPGKELVLIAGGVSIARIHTQGLRATMSTSADMP